MKTKTRFSHVGKREFRIFMRNDPMGHLLTSLEADARRRERLLAPRLGTVLKKVAAGLALVFLAALYVQDMHTTAKVGLAKFALSIAFSGPVVTAVSFVHEPWADDMREVAEGPCFDRAADLLIARIEGDTGVAWYNFIACSPIAKI